MITFILGEDRHVKYFVHSIGQYEKDEEKNGYYVDAKIQPVQKSRMYTLEIELKIADEIIKNREKMEVI